MAKKRYPVQRRSTAQLATPATSALLNVNRFLSRLNHRLYRQGRFYETKIDIDLSAADAGSPIQVYVLRDTWANQKAYQMAFDVYQKTTAAERARIGKDMQARWEDFTVVSGNTSAELLPQVYDAVAGTYAQLSVGEFLNSQIEDTAGNTMIFTWGGGAAGSQYGIVAEYSKYANLDNTPDNTITDVPYSEQNEDISNVEIQTITNRGNSPPYSAGTFSDVWMEVASLSRTPGQQRLSTGYFTAPCGFVLITGLNGAASNPVHVEVKAGDYKGVHAPSMLEPDASKKQLGYASSKKWKSMGVSTR